MLQLRPLAAALELVKALLRLYLPLPQQVHNSLPVRVLLALHLLRLQSVKRLFKVLVLLLLRLRLLVKVEFPLKHKVLLLELPMLQGQDKALPKRLVRSLLLPTYKARTCLWPLQLVLPLLLARQSPTVTATESETVRLPERLRHKPSARPSVLPMPSRSLHLRQQALETLRYSHQVTRLLCPWFWVRVLQYNNASDVSTSSVLSQEWMRRTRSCRMTESVCLLTSRT